MSQLQAIDVPLVASPSQTMTRLMISREKLYQLINTGELESFSVGRSRRIMVASIDAYIQRRLAAEVARRGRTA